MDICFGSTLSSPCQVLFGERFFFDDLEGILRDEIFPLKVFLPGVDLEMIDPESLIDFRGHPHAKVGGKVRREGEGGGGSLLNGIQSFFGVIDEVLGVTLRASIFLQGPDILMEFQDARYGSSDDLGSRSIKFNKFRDFSRVIRQRDGFSFLEVFILFRGCRKLQLLGPRILGVRSLMGAKESPPCLLR